MLPLRSTHSPVLGFVLKALFSALSLLAIYYIVDVTKARTISAATPETVDSEAIDTWWPANGVEIEGTQPFKFFMPDRSVESYDAFWSVDGGAENKMQNSYTDYPHKEAKVNLSEWTWRDEGPYLISFVAREKSGAEIARESLVIYTGEADIDSVEHVVTTEEDASSEDTSEDETDVADEPEDSDDQADSDTEANITGDINVWWPTEDSRLSGVQPFKAMIPGVDVSDYDMSWSVDGGDWNRMGESDEDYPHKEAMVDVEEWDQSENGSYTVEFRALDDGEIVAEASVDVYVDQYDNRATTQNSASTDELVEPTYTQSSVTDTANSVVPNGEFYVDPNSRAKAQADAWRNSRPEDAALMDILAAQPSAAWFGDWNSDVYTDVRNKVSAAGDKMSVLIAYNIPQRDCGHYSAGGAGGYDAYRNWISDFARGIGSSKAIVVLEPDALAGIDCLSAGDQEKRMDALQDAIQVLKNQENVSVYVDAGNPHWKSTDVMATRLKRAGIDQADGFALNVSNFFTTEDNVSYGEELSGKLGGKHFVIDTSRNGRGPAPDHQWCNPRGRGLGELSTFDTGNSLVDAFLWLKTPGESDGSCNGDPGAGQWFPEYALELVKNRAF